MKSRDKRAAHLPKTRQDTAHDARIPTKLELVSGPRRFKSGTFDLKVINIPFCSA